MKILYITDFYYVSSSGAKTSAIAHLNTLRNLYGEGNVDVIALVGKDIPNNPEKNHIVVQGSKNKVILMIECLRGYSTYLNYKGMCKILSIINKKKYDAVFIDNSIYGQLIKKIKILFPELLVLSYYHDVKAKLATDWLNKASFYRKPVYQAMLNNEKLTSKWADVNLVLSDREERLYRLAYGKKPEAQLSVYMDIPLADNYFKRKNKKRKRLLFFGGYYIPNVNGINWFVDNVLNKIDDEIELLIAGREMDRLNEKSYPSNVKIEGFVEKIDDVYKDADIIVSPIFEGGGMKVKVAEAIAYGKIVIGSDESYEGYQEKIPDIYWNKFFYRANSAEEFVDKINIALNSDPNMLHFNREIREVYEENFSEQYAEKQISRVIDKYLNKGENK